MTEPLVFGKKVKENGIVLCGSWNNANFISDEYESSFELNHILTKLFEELTFTIISKDLSNKNNFKMLKDNILKLDQIKL